MKTAFTFLLTCFTLSLSAQDKDSAKFYFSKGLEAASQKKFLVAVQAFDKAVIFDPLYTDAYLQNANANLEMRRTDIAKKHFIKVHELQPANQEVTRQLMELYFNYRQYDQAIAFARMCQNCPGTSRVLGMSYYQQEDYARAETALKEAVGKNPNDAEATYTLGRTFLDMEEYKKAVPFFKRAVDLDSTRGAWMYELGLIYYTLADYKNAVGAFNKASAHGYAKSNDFNENLGYALLYSGEFEKGETLLMGVLAKKPGNKDIIRDMAEILYREKQYDRSLFYCEKLLQIDSKDAKALYQAGLNFQKKGNVDRGSQMCDKAIEMDPSLASLRQEKKMPVGL